MTERKRDLLTLLLFLALLVLFFAKILFTDKIVRAPDIINESYWWIKNYAESSIWDLLRINLKASWDYTINSGHTNNGGMASLQFLLYQRMIFHLIPLPASVAWFMVLHLFFGGVGVFYCCRLIGCGRAAALLAGLVFALSPENASLINAGHVMKIATISFAPWAFYFLERGFRSRRLIFFMATGLVLALQFFNTHWQIAFYTCLCVGAYGLLRSVGILMTPGERESFPAPRLLGLNLVVLAFFLTTVSISLLPLTEWSKDTNRGAQSGANQGRGGLNRDEAMSWSLPPEEMAAFIIPGIFGLSRQEAGENPTNIRSYYWGRMVFTQTQTYMGLLPWLLLPLPLIFRRDKYTWLAVAGVAGGILFSMGKYTPIYNLLFDYFPGINRFRVPKMMMFVPVMGLGVLAARGIDLLREEGIRATPAFRRYLAGVAALLALLLVLLAMEAFGKGYWLSKFSEMLSQPTRYEDGGYLVMQRWNNLMIETGIAAAFAALCATAIAFGGRVARSAVLLPALLIVLYMADVWRVDDKFMFLVNAPTKSKGEKPPVVQFLAGAGKMYRVLPMDSSDPMQYATNGIPVMFTSNAVQQQRWQEFLDSFDVVSTMPDMLNVRYLLLGAGQFAQERGALGNKFAPVYTTPDGQTVVLENRSVLPKAWLTSSVYQVAEPRQELGIMHNPAFDPRRVSLVETPPELPLAPMTGAGAEAAGSVTVSRYEGEHIDVNAAVRQNALLVLGEKYARGWRAFVDGKEVRIHPVNYVLRGVYLSPGSHRVEFRFDPLLFKVGTYLTLGSFALFAVLLIREALAWRRKRTASTVAQG